MLELLPCSEEISRDCADFEEIVSYFNQTKFDMFIQYSGQYIDFKNQTNPVQKVWKNIEGTDFRMNVGQKVEQTLNLALNELTVHNSFFNDIAGEEETTNFFTVETKSTTMNYNQEPGDYLYEAKIQL